MLPALGLGETRLSQMPKSAPEKMVLAWWLRRGTTVSLRWLSQRLAMGHFTRVSQATGLVQRRAHRTCERLNRRLTRIPPQKGVENETCNMQRLQVF